MKLIGNQLALAVEEQQAQRLDGRARGAEAGIGDQILVRGQEQALLQHRPCQAYRQFEHGLEAEGSMIVPGYAAGQLPR
ncbi:hypothetical protein TSH7_04655 [Azospirillum sp. TSH7]|nr:hypothetical protein TSH20_24730 [Azospirillum sp. TSH20]PWC67290.1 hypothetical protein TSH7_04655 [Azospirillum sp. TSH7]